MPFERFRIWNGAGPASPQNGIDRCGDARYHYSARWRKGRKPMSQHLEYLIEEARKHKITPEERDAQVRSFAYGNAHLENPAITRADVDEAMDALNAEREPATTVRS